MLLIPISLHLAYMVLIKKKRFYLLYHSLFYLAIDSLPSLIKEYFLLQINERFVGPMDILVLITLTYFVFDRNARGHIRLNASLAFIVTLSLAFESIKLVHLWLYQGAVESSHLREAYMGSVVCVVMLVNLEALGDKKEEGRLSRTLILYNLITAATAVVVFLFPTLNQPDSRTWTMINVPSATGALALVSNISGYVALFSLYYDIVVLQKGVFKLGTILAGVLVLITAHRIIYVGAFLLVLYDLYLIAKRVNYIDSRNMRERAREIWLMAALLTIIVILPFNNVILDSIQPYIDRGLTAFDPLDKTRLDRFDQVGYFLHSYLPGNTFTTHLIGQGYWPIDEKDYFYSKIVSPHNMLIQIWFERGMIGLSLFLWLMIVVIRRCLKAGGSRFLIMTFIILIMASTDGGFIHYPFSAFFAIMIGLTVANTGKGYSQPRLRQFVPVNVLET